jgi:hypothetical protein
MSLWLQQHKGLLIVPTLKDGVWDELVSKFVKLGNACRKKRHQKHCMLSRARSTNVWKEYVCSDAVLAHRFSCTYRFRKSFAGSHAFNAGLALQLCPLLNVTCAM